MFLSAGQACSVISQLSFNAEESSVHVSLYTAWVEVGGSEYYPNSEGFKEGEFDDANGR